MPYRTAPPIAPAPPPKLVLEEIEDLLLWVDDLSTIKEIRLGVGAYFRLLQEEPPSIRMRCNRCTFEHFYYARLPGTVSVRVDADCSRDTIELVRI